MPPSSEIQLLNNRQQHRPELIARSLYRLIETATRT
jgi:hypothetical protein